MLIKPDLKNVLIPLVVLLVLLFSCKKVSDPNEGSDLVINYDLLETTITLRFVDAASGEFIPDNANLEVKPMGGQAAAVLDISGRSKEAYQGKMGVVELALKPGHGPASGTAFSLQLYIRASGYFSTGFSEVLTEKGPHIYEIRLMKRVDLPEGASRGTGESYSDGQGRVTQSTDVSVSNNMASLLVPEGAVLKGPGNSPLIGNLNINIYHFSNLEDVCLQSFPGTLKAFASLPDGENRQVMLFPAGHVFMSINDQNGMFAKTIEGKPLMLSMNVPPETYKGAGNSQIEDGDMVPVWHFNEQEANWSLEFADTISQFFTGGYRINSAISSLSWWSFAWYEDNLCQNGLRLDFSDNEIPCDCYWVKLEARNTHNQGFLWQEYRRFCKGQPLSVKNVPAVLPVDLYISGMCGELSTTEDFYGITNLCSQYLLDVEWNQHETFSAFQLELTAYCNQNEAVKIKPGFGVWYRKTDDFCWQWSAMKSGKAELCHMQPGVDYQIGFYYDGNWEEFRVVPQYGNYIYHDFTLTAEVCSEVFGY